LRGIRFSELLGSDEDSRLIGLREGEWLSTHQPAIDRDHGPRHVVGQISREEFDHLGAILHGPEPPQSDQLGSITVA
jgi:hypothetical protein